MTVNLWSCCLHFPSGMITGMQHTCFMRCEGWNPEFHACLAITLPTEFSFLVSFPPPFFFAWFFLSIYLTFIASLEFTGEWYRGSASTLAHAHSMTKSPTGAFLVCIPVFLHSSVCDQICPIFLYFSFQWCIFFGFEFYAFFSHKKWHNSWTFLLLNFLDFECQNKWFLGVCFLRFTNNLVRPHMVV